MTLEDSVGRSVVKSVWGLVKDSINSSIYTSVHGSVENSVWGSVKHPGEISVWLAIDAVYNFMRSYES
jgi:hypothetical protein